MRMETVDQATHYHSNVYALKGIAKWLDIKEIEVGWNYQLEDKKNIKRYI